jgi:tripartite-type tricarboxylate transporter receptor subunit TctC
LPPGRFALVPLSARAQNWKPAKLRVLAIGAPQRRQDKLAGVPTRKDVGVDSAQDLWRGLAGAPGFTPAQTGFFGRHDSIAAIALRRK